MYEWNWSWCVLSIEYCPCDTTEWSFSAIYIWWRCLYWFICWVLVVYYYTARVCIFSLMCFICPAVYLIWCQLLRMVSYSWVHAVHVVNGYRRTRCSDFLSILSAMEASGSISSSMCVDVCRKCLGLLEEVTRDQMTVVFYVAVDVSSEWRNSVSVNASNSVRYSRVCYYMCGYYKWVLDRI